MFYAPARHLVVIFPTPYAALPVEIEMKLLCVYFNFLLNSNVIILPTSLTCDEQLSICSPILLWVFQQPAAGLLQAESRDERYRGECPAGILTLFNKVACHE